MFNDDLPKKTEFIIKPGEDLSDLGLQQLDERKAILEDEILRVDEISKKKRQGLVSAEDFFRKT